MPKFRPYCTICQRYYNYLVWVSLLGPPAVIWLTFLALQHAPQYSPLDLLTPIIGSTVFLWACRAITRGRMKHTHQEG